MEQLQQLELHFHVVKDGIVEIKNMRAVGQTLSAIETNLTTSRAKLSHGIVTEITSQMRKNVQDSAVYFNQKLKAYYRDRFANPDISLDKEIHKLRHSRYFKTLSPKNQQILYFILEKLETGSREDFIEVLIKIQHQLLNIEMRHISKMTQTDHVVKFLSLIRKQLNYFNMLIPERRKVICQHTQLILDTVAEMTLHPDEITISSIEILTKIDNILLMVQQDGILTLENRQSLQFDTSQSASVGGAYAEQINHCIDHFCKERVQQISDTKKKVQSEQMSIDFNVIRFQIFVEAHVKKLLEFVQPIEEILENGKEFKYIKNHFLKFNNVRTESRKVLRELDKYIKNNFEEQPIQFVLQKVNELAETLRDVRDCKSEFQVLRNAKSLLNNRDNSKLQYQYYKKRNELLKLEDTTARSYASLLLYYNELEILDLRKKLREIKEISKKQLFGMNLIELVQYAHKVNPELVKDGSQKQKTVFNSLGFLHTLKKIPKELGDAVLKRNNIHTEQLLVDVIQF
ncbi:MAG: hypothetical protein HQM14_15570 [SAR324 cluster bacterium]|nr:hypothetical protein [SAR324 cluster bacterium]